MKFKKKQLPLVLVLILSTILLVYLINKKINSASLGVCPKCNIVLISVDSLRADHVGALGYTRDTTPNFDKLSKKGFLFENYFTTSFLTPFSEMSVHTGLYQQSHGVTNFNEVLPTSKQTLAEYLKTKNFSTIALISSPEFIVNKALHESFSRGFDQYNLVNSSREYPTATRITQELTFLGDKQFFLWLPVGGVHWPFLKSKNIFADQGYDGYFKNKRLGWEDFENIYDMKVYPQGTKLDEKDLQFVVDQYDNGVRGFDDFLGQVIVVLEDKKLIDNTIIIIQSEHGESLGERGYIAHYDIHETEIHTPLMILVPSVGRGKRILSFASPVDIVPTVLDLFGFKTSQKIEGKSLVSLLNGKEKDGLRNEAYMERNPLWEEVDDGILKVLKDKNIKLEHKSSGDIAIRTDKWKYIMRLDKNRVEKVSWWGLLTQTKITIPDSELYDIVNDPKETKNVVAEYPAEAEILKKKLLDWKNDLVPANTSEIKIEGEIQPYF